MASNNFIGKDKILLVTVCVVVLLVVVAIFWANKDDMPSDPASTDPTGAVNDTGQSTDPSDEDRSLPTSDDGISIDKIAMFSGAFVEDASDEPVENVAAILVTNRSDRFLDLANVNYDVDGKKATFIVTGLPAGSSAWVMEYSGMTISSSDDMKYQGCTTSFRDDAISTTEELTLDLVGDMLVAVNVTDRPLENVFVYYKSIHTDGNYFGGITYMVNFGTLEPGVPVEKMAAHFIEGETKIVRIGWQESQIDGSS